MELNKIFSGFAVAVIVFCSSCQKTEFPDTWFESVDKGSGLLTDDPNLSPEDAVGVAQKFYSDQISTRSDAEKRIKNVVTIKDDSGDPAIYAVNFQDGYLLVSATKTYYPILARVEHGTFTLGVEKTGQDVVIQEMLDGIKDAKDSVCDFKCKHLWFPYEQKQIPERVRTRANDDFYAMQDEWWMKWVDEGRKVYYLYRQPDDLPDDVYQRFCTDAAELDAWADTELNCMNSAIITEKLYENHTQKGPFVYANWGQGAPYNSNVSGGYPLGCVTVAVGQLMRYYEHPAYFGWSDMPCRGGSSATLSAFLAELRRKLEVTDEGTSNIRKAKNVFESYGYKCEKAAHSATAVCSALQDNRPVFTRGEDKSRNKGHAWVIDGSTSSTSYTEYKLYMLNNCAYPEFEYIELDSWRNYHVHGLVFFHMNWGWDGSGNGWFLDSRIGFTRDDKVYVNYSSGREDLIIKRN